MSIRRHTKRVYIGNVPIGGGAPIVIQSMTNTNTKDVKKTVEQINALADAGAKIVRIALPDLESAEKVGEIKKYSRVPLVGDIHFDHRIALKAIENGIDGIRLNPGNIKNRKYIEKVAQACMDKNIPIRVGVNSGSLDKKYKEITPENLVASALDEIRLLEEIGFFNIKVSIKASSVELTVKANRLMSEERDYPIHLGITEAGLYEDAIIKSSMGIGALLLDGIGDTIRVSITGDPIQEIPIAKKILKYAGLLEEGIEIIACPTCARMKIDVFSFAKEIEDRFKRVHITKPLKIAVMGCEVNGPGEAKEADLGIAGSKRIAIVFKKGKIIYKGQKEKAIGILLEEAKKV